MWKPWEWGSASHVGALDNARAASTELSRRRVEREEVALFLEEWSGPRRRVEAG